MRRREFILGGISATWARVASAQQQSTPLIGFLSSLSSSDLPLILPAFNDGLRALGFVEGRSVLIEYRWADGDYGRLPAMAADLAGLNVSVLAAISGTPAALAAKAATSTIPIVIAIGGDPIAAGLVANLNRPGGNITGASFYTSPLVTKRLDLARELAPQGRLIAVLLNPKNPPSVAEGIALQEAAAVVGQPLRIFHASTKGEIDDAFVVVEQLQAGALIVSSDPLFFTERVKLVVLMARNALPTIFADREQAEAGGLISYGASRADAYRQAGNYAGRILKGERPSEMPVVLPTNFQLLINIKTAKSLRINIPPTVIARADEVIE